VPPINNAFIANAPKGEIHPGCAILYLLFDVQYAEYIDPRKNQPDDFRRVGYVIRFFRRRPFQPAAESRLFSVPQDQDNDQGDKPRDKGSYDADHAVQGRDGPGTTASETRGLHHTAPQKG
jgi:hypothetical protein